MKGSFKPPKLVSADFLGLGSRVCLCYYCYCYQLLLLELEVKLPNCHPFCPAPPAPSRLWALLLTDANLVLQLSRHPAEQVDTSVRPQSSKQCKNYPQPWKNMYLAGKLGGVRGDLRHFWKLFVIGGSPSGA